MTIIKAALIGNPNCGKTTLFNGLTGARQRVGNWPGVTVERKEGSFQLPCGTRVEVVDLPGIYSLEQDDIALDEKIAREFLASENLDIVINVLDASCLDRQLLLTHQLRDYGHPMLVMVNMMDIARANGVEIDLGELSQCLGCPVVGGSAIQPITLQSVAESILPATELSAGQGPNLLNSSGERITERLEQVQAWFSRVVSQSSVKESMTEKIDRLLLNRYLGVPAFLAVMYLLFTFSISLGAVFIDFFDMITGAWLVGGMHYVLSWLHAPAWLSVLIADGLGGGVQLVSTFIPVIGFLYLGLAFLEESGYIVRAAFVVDRLMRAIGLPGKAFVPLIVGFGCNVPAIMATRTMNTESDRIVTIAMAPFMSCGARLPVYALFAAALFGQSGQNIVFCLYLLGIIAAIATGWLFRQALYRGELSSSIMEMPMYHLPSVRNILITTWHRLNGFVRRAGKTIVAVVVVLSFLNSWGTDGSFGNEDSQQSMLSYVGRLATPVLNPLGVANENWPATVGIITGIFAKEAVVGTLDSLYSNNSDESIEEDTETLIEQTQAAFASIWVNLLDLTTALVDPLGIQVGSYDSMDEAAEDQELHGVTLSSMATLFATPFAAFCYLVLILMYTPCVAAMGALVREAGQQWAWVIIAWTSLLAYATSVSIYQLGTFWSHPAMSIIWVCAMAMLVFVFYRYLMRLGRRELGKRRANLIPTQTI